MDSRLKLRRGAPKKTKCGFGFFVVIFIAFAVLLVGLNLSVIVGQSTQLLQTNNQEGGQSLKTLSGENVNALSNVKESQVHVVFSTSCGVKQDWQSYLFFFIAMIQMQQGTVTRIVSGCDPEQEAEMSKIFQEKIAIMNENFYLHFTPEFGKIPGKNQETTRHCFLSAFDLYLTMLKVNLSKLQNIGTSRKA